MPYNPLNPFESYTHVYSPAPNSPAAPPAMSTKPSPSLPSDPFEAADSQQIAAQDLLYTQQQPLIEAAYEARDQAALVLKVRAAQRKKHWQTQAAKRKQERADKRYGSREQTAQAQAERDANRQLEKKYQALALDRRLDNKHHMRLISRKKVASTPKEVSAIHTEIKALIVKINQTKAEIRLLKGVKPKPKPNTPKAYRVDTKMDAATKAAFQNS